MNDLDDDPTQALRDADSRALRDIARKTFTCDQCHTSGSADWMTAHDCAHNQYVDENGGHCEDYPCCGHTDGDGCRTQESHTSNYWLERLTDLQDRGYDDYDIDMMFSREED